MECHAQGLTFNSVVAPESQIAGIAKKSAALSLVAADCFRNLLLLVPLATCTLAAAESQLEAHSDGTDKYIDQ